MAEEATAPIAEAIQAAPEEVGVKVFVGNLAFATTAEDIKAAFADSGEILDAQIIKRGDRSLGYGFVTFAQEDDATKAVSKLDKSEISGRTINVEIAKPGKGARGGDVAADAAGAARGRGKPRRGGPSGRGGRRPAADGEADGAVAGEDGDVNGITDGVAGLTTGEGEDGAAPRGARRGRGRGRGGRRGEPRKPVGPPEGEPSKTLVFVANLPWGINDETLKGIFEGLAVESSHVIVRKYGYTAGRSKGFGFVNFTNEDDQKKAVETYHGKEIEADGVKREISVKIAVDAAKAEAQAESETAPAATTDAEVKEVAA